MSKRQQEQEGKAAGGCCSGRNCGSHGQAPWGVLLDDAIFTDTMSGREAEIETCEGRRREGGNSNTEVDTTEGARAETMEAGAGGKKGQDYINKLSNSIGSQRDTISGGEAKVVREEARLCGGCNSLGARQVFSSEQWKKEDAWSREYARRCKRCEEREEREGCEGPVQGDSALVGSRARRTRKPTLPVETREDRCRLRKIDQVLCVAGCVCGNALPVNTGGAGGGSGVKARAVKGEGLQGEARGVWATAAIEQGEIITCFGEAATVKGTREVQDLTKALRKLRAAEDGECQYSLSGNLEGEDNFSPTEVWVIPPPDVACLLQTNPSSELKRALNKRGPRGIGHLANHTCCRDHRNALLELRWVSEDKQLATVVVVASRKIGPGERILVHYAPEGNAFKGWAQTFACTCCKCRGACGGMAATGPESFVNFVNSMKALEPEWDTGVSRKRKVKLGTRVRAKIKEGDMIGNVIGWEEQRVVIQGACTKRNDGSVINIEEQEREKVMTRATVDEKDCEIVEDWLQWGQSTLQMDALLRVRHQIRAAGREDYIEDSVLMAMLRWGLHGESESVGLPAQVHNDWLVDSYTFKKVQLAWQVVERNSGPLVSLLESLGHQDVHRKMKGTELQVNPAFHRNIYIPIHLDGGDHWLMACIETRTRKLQLLDCSQEFGRAWRGRLHALLWVWFLASVRRIRKEHEDNVREPIWSIDLSRVRLKDLELLPGFNRANIQELTRMRTDVTSTIEGARRVLGTEGLGQLSLLNIEVRWGGEAGEDRWQWSANIKEVPQQRRGSDCAVFTLLYAAFKVRDWNMTHLRGLNPQAARRWILHILLKGGVWKRCWTCALCGEDTEREVASVEQGGGGSQVRCQGAKEQECKNRRVAKGAAGVTSTQGRAMRAISEGGARKEEGKNPEDVAEKRARREREGAGVPVREPTKRQTAGRRGRDSPVRKVLEEASHNDVPMEKVAGEAESNRQEHRQQGRLGGNNKVGTSGEGCPTPKAENQEVKEELIGRPKAGGHFSKPIFKIREDGEREYRGDVACETCGLWGASLKVDKDRNEYVCNKVCKQRWRLRELVRGAEKRKREGAPKEEPSAESPLLPRPEECEACNNVDAQHPCIRCGVTWYCNAECQQQHWDTHQKECEPGPWCAVCGAWYRKIGALRATK